MLASLMDGKRCGCRITNMKNIVIVAMVVLVLPAPVRAQLALPNVPVLPTQRVPEVVNSVTQRANGTVNEATRRVTAQTQQVLHSTQVQSLLRAHRDTLEADPNGAPLVRGQLVAVAPTAQALQQAQAAGYAISQDQVLDALGMRVVTLLAPPGMSTRSALQRLRKLDRDGSYDYNHVYLQSGVAQAVTAAGASSVTNPPTFDASRAVRVGLIDGGIDSHHEVFNHVTVHQHGCAAQPIISDHGTAVASLLVGQSSKFNGAAAGATLYAADVYCGQPIGGSMARIADALSWLAEQQVPVINVSLVGPDNALLKQLIQKIIAHGHIIVAAVGNDGPAAPPLYPAAYPDVVGVTAVDANNKVIVEAGRGTQVDFAAPGADLAAAMPDNFFAAVRGTSFAAPLVAGMLALHLDRVQTAAATQAINLLATSAHRLSTRVPDKLYGYGIVGESLRVSLAGLPTRDALDHQVGAR